MPCTRALAAAAWLAALGPAQQPQASRSCDVRGGTAAAFAGRPWPMGKIPYLFDASVPPAGRRQARAAMDEWEAVCGVRFVPHRAQAFWIRIRASQEDRSWIGRLGGEQTLEIASWHRRFVICHELCHAMGFWHEHQRGDRDRFVRIHEENVQPLQMLNFWRAGFADSLGLPYDFDSVMHYEQRKMSRNGGRTITVLPPHQVWQDRIGQRDHLSELDRRRARMVYPPPRAALTAGLRLADDGLGGDVIILRDVDGDGVADPLVSLPRHGSGRGVLWWIGSRRRRPVATLVGSSGQGLGSAVGRAPDLDGDGVFDLLVGSGDGRAGAISVGRWRRGSADPWLWRHPAVATGRSVSAILATDDLDGDHVPDIVLGVPAGRGAIESRSGATGKLLWRLVGAVGGSELGAALALVEDLDRDGARDLAAGAPGAGPGTLTLVSGRHGAVLRRPWSLPGLQPGARLGATLAFALDADRDGKRDLLVGAPGAARVLAVALSSGRVVRTWNGPANSALGASRARPGDLDGDGFDDVAFGAPGEGSVRVLGGPSGHWLLDAREPLAGLGTGAAIAPGRPGAPGRLWALAASAASLVTFTPAARLRAEQAVLGPLLGGTVALELDLGGAHAGHGYALLVSTSGDRPGLRVGELRLPLQPDAATAFGLLAGDLFLRGWRGRLDPAGRARAQLRLPPLLASPWSGRTLTFAGVVFDRTGLRAVTNPAVVRITR